MTARSVPEDWHLALPDLRSRLAATPRARIGAPDDMLLRHLFLKLWRDRGIDVPPELATYVLNRIERSFAAVGEAVERMNAASLATRRPPTIALAREALLDMVAPSLTGQAEA
jgi:chromosomal replication initiation ATPase DnaA